MKVIIFEGIASSGKTTLGRLLMERLGNVALMTEDQTLMELIDNHSADVAFAYLQKLIDSFAKKKSAYLLIDRFHLTHTFRTKQTSAFFKILEQRLLEYHPLLILLTVDPASLQQRIEATTALRQGSWTKRKAGTIEERVRYYTEQQDILRQLFVESVLPKMEIDTTAQTWPTYLEQIVARCNENSRFPT